MELPQGFKEFDPAEYLTDPEDVVEYLNAFLEDGSAQEVAMALGTVARSEGMSRIARDTGLNRVSLYTSLSEDGNPSLGTFMKVLDVLGLKLAVKRKSRGDLAGAVMG